MTARTKILVFFNVLFLANFVGLLISITAHLYGLALLIGIGWFGCWMAKELLLNQ